MQPTQPAAERPKPVSAKKLFRKQVIAWMGIIGGAITVFGNLRELLNLADWARWLAAHWHELMYAIWAWVFGLVHIPIPKLLSPGLSFALFVTMVVIGTRMRFADHLFSLPGDQVRQRFGLAQWLGWSGWLIILTLWPLAGWFLLLFGIIDTDFDEATGLLVFFVFLSLPLIIFSLFFKR